jgi:hypothetical protein
MPQKRRIGTDKTIKTALRGLECGLNTEEKTGLDKCNAWIMQNLRKGKWIHFVLVNEQRRGRRFEPCIQTLAVV